MSQFSRIGKALFVFCALVFLCAHSSIVAAVGQARFLADIKSGAGSLGGSDGRFVVADVGGKTYISVKDAFGRGLWVTDGSSAGTKRLIAADSSLNVGDLEFNSVHNGIVYFNTTSIPEGDPAHLLATDGSSAGTFIVKAFSTYSNDEGGFFPGIGTIFWHNNVGYFKGWDSVAGQELWRTDGTTSGTVMIRDILPGSTPVDPDVQIEGETYPYSSNPRIFFERNGTVYFVGAGRLYQTDGTEAGTTTVGDFSISRGLYFDEDYLIFARDGGRISLINLKSPGEFVPIDLGSDFYRIRTLAGVVLWNSRLYFVASETFDSGYDLWVSNLSADSATLLKEIRGAPADSDIRLFSNKHLINNGSEMVFSATDGVHGREPWVTDGTTAGTQMLKDVRIGSKSSITSAANFRANPIVVKNRVLFTLYNDATGYEFWVTNDGSSKINLLKDIRPGTGSSTSFGLYQNINSRFYFQANNGVNGNQMWTTDLTSAGTQMIDILSSGANLKFLRSRGKNTLLYTTYQAGSGFKLWAYDLDVDGDNRIDAQDNCPDQANSSQADFDLDGLGNVCDSDADNDGMPADWEQQFGLNDLNPSDALLDTDGDGINNLTEYNDGTNPTIANPDCNRDGLADARDRCVKIQPILMLLSSGNSLPTFTVQEGDSPGATDLIISDDKSGFDYVIEQLQTGDSSGPLDPLPTPIFINGSSGSERKVILQRFLSEQSDWTFTATVTDSDGEVLVKEVDFGVP